MDSMILAALIGAIAAIVAAIIGRVIWRRRKKSPKDAFYNAFHAGWGLGSLMDEWINIPIREVTSNFLAAVSRVQPYFNTLGLGVDLRKSFRKGKLFDDLMLFISQIETKISAEFGKKAGYAFELGQALVLNTKDIYRYATDDTHRRMVESQDAGLSAITAAIDEPLSQLHLGEVIEREWADIVSSIKAEQFDKNKLWPAIEAWIEKVHDSIERMTADKTA